MLALWTLWLVLTALLFIQVRIATSDEIAIPDAVLRAVERRMAGHGLRFTFGAIHCDSSGHVVVRDLKLFSNQHPDPVFTMRAARFEINPHAFLMRNIAPRMAGRIDGASLRLPAMFSSAGANAAVIDDINAEVEIKSSLLVINGLTARVGNLSLLCRGSAAFLEIQTRRRPDGDAMPDMITAYLDAARAFDAWTARLEAFDDPVLDVTLTPDPERIASARVELFAGGLRLPPWQNTEAPPPSADANACGPLLADTTLALGDLFQRHNAAPDTPRPPPPPLRVRFATTNAVFNSGIRAQNLRLALTMPLADALRPGGKNIASPADMSPVNMSVLGTADSLTARDITARAITAQLYGQFPKKLHASVTTRVLGEPLALETDADLVEKEATASLVTRVAPPHIAALSRELKYDIGKILQPGRPVEISATARLAPGWRFAGASGALDIGPILADDVRVIRAHGDFSYDHAKGEIIFSPAMAVVEDSFARGSFAMNFATLDYRFLLKGNLRPRSIDGWLGPWWPGFWKRFTFDGPAAFGDVDVQGNFRNVERTRVFVFADAATLTYNTVALDRVLLTLFTRPDYFDALDLFARRGAGYARGSFTHQNLDPGNRPLLTVFDFKAENIDPVAVVPAISEELAKDLAILKFEEPPAQLRVAGRIDGPASPRGRHALIDVSAEGNGAFTYDRIPLKSLSTNLRVRDDVFSVDRLDTQFAGGHLALKAQISGAGLARQIGFDVNLNNAGFGQTWQRVAEIIARKRGDPPPEDDLHRQPADARLDFRFSADGRLSDDFSFTGNGSAEIARAELVNVNLFGALSQALRDVKVLNFTSLNLTDGQFNFTLDRRRVVIPEAVLTGKSALVKLSGEYTLDNRFANLTAKVYPLSESRNILSKGLGFLLVPVTHLTELKLTGLLDAPKWRFSYGPTSFFRALVGKGSDTESLEQEYVTSGAPSAQPPEADVAAQAVTQAAAAPGVVSPVMPAAPGQAQAPVQAPMSTVPEALRRLADGEK
jgi:hypothetical protein